MATPLPSRLRLPLLRHPCVLLGAILGACLAGIAIAWLLVANRAPTMAQFALERNLIAASAIAVIMLLPFFLFLGSPRRIFLSGVIAWAILAVCYWLLGFLFVHLANRLSAFHLFALGAIVLGVVAALDWVALIVIAARRTPLVMTRR